MPSKKTKDKGAKAARPTNGAGETVQVPTRLTKEEHEALWALHVKTRRSMSVLIREALLKEFAVHSILTRERVKEILAGAKAQRHTVKAPVI